MTMARSAALKDTVVLSLTPEEIGTVLAALQHVLNHGHDFPLMQQCYDKLAAQTLFAEERHG